MQADLEAGCQADHVLTYLNTIVDDIAQIIIIATGVSRPKQRMESMGDLKHPVVLPLPGQAGTSPRQGNDDHPRRLEIGLHGERALTRRETDHLETACHDRFKTHFPGAEHLRPSARLSVRMPT